MDGNISSMKKILRTFVKRTKADPHLAQDLLDATGWDLQAALTAYEGLNVTSTEVNNDEFEDIDISTMNELVGGGRRDLALISEEGDELVRKRSTKKIKAKGLSHVAEEVGDLFRKVAVSESKLSAGADKKEKVFDEQFFRHSFLYPDFSSESQEFQHFISRDIIEKSHKYTLEKSGHLNWWASTGKLPVLEPLATSGDGNCLLHAASLYMWGLPDRDLILRTHLHRLLTTGLEKQGLQRRWRYLTNLRNQDAGGLTFSEEEWEFEWSEIVRIATNQPRRRPTTDSLRRYSTLRIHYESLEEIHVFAMSNVLHRPIIVVADEYVRDFKGDPFAPIYFGGIYLPMECNPSLCYKSPVILAFDSSHFSPLVAKKEPGSSKSKGRLRHLGSRQDTVMPLVNPDGSLLPLPFVYDPKKRDISECWAKEKCKLGEFPDEIRTLLDTYLDIRWIQLDIGSEVQESDQEDDGSLRIPVKVPKFRFPGAVISNLGEPDYQSMLVVKYLENAHQRFEAEKERKTKIEEEKARQEEEFKKLQAKRPVPCKGEDCTMFGTIATNSLCSMCYAKYQDSETEMSTPPLSPPIRQLVSPVSSPSRKSSRTQSFSHSRQIKENDSPIDGEHVTERKWDIVLPDLPVTSTKTPLLPNQQSSQNLSEACNVQTDSENLKNDSQNENSSKESQVKEVKEPPKPPLKPAPKPKPKVPTSTTVPAPPPRPFNKGYSRDSIQPIVMTHGVNIVPTTTGSRMPCKTTGCEFFGSSQHGGLCSQCYHKRNKKVTEV